MHGVVRRRQDKLLTSSVEWPNLTRSVGRPERVVLLHRDQTVQTLRRTQDEFFYQCENRCVFSCPPCGYDRISDEAISI